MQREPILACFRKQLAEGLVHKDSLILRFLFSSCCEVFQKCVTCQFFYDSWYSFVVNQGGMDCTTRLYCSRELFPILVMYILYCDPCSCKQCSTATGNTIDTRAP